MTFFLERWCFMYGWYYGLVSFDVVVGCCCLRVVCIFCVCCVCFVVLCFKQWYILYITHDFMFVCVVCFVRFVCLVAFLACVCVVLLLLLNVACCFCLYFCVCLCLFVLCCFCFNTIVSTTHKAWLPFVCLLGLMLWFGCFLLVVVVFVAFVVWCWLLYSRFCC